MDENNLPEKRVNSKKLQRLESKKKKAAAFLALVRQSATDLSCQQSMSTEISGDSSVKTMSSEILNPAGTTMSELSHEDQEDVIAEQKRIIRERKKQAMQKPRLFLTLEDMVTNAPLDVPIPPEIIPPLFVMDLQQLLLYAVQGNQSSFKPRFCKLLRVAKVASVVVILVDGLGCSDYMENKECFPYISQSFDTSCEIVSPLQYNRSVETELHAVPLSITQIKKANVKVPSHIRQRVAALMRLDQCKPKDNKDNVKKDKVNADVDNKDKVNTEKVNPDKVNTEKVNTEKVNTDKFNTDSNTDKVKIEKVTKDKAKTDKAQTDKAKTDSISRKCLLLSTHQMMQEGYPLPIATEKGNYRNFVFTKDKYAKVTDNSPLFALDCEMCLTVLKKNELTRVSIVNQSGELVYDKLVKPYRKIINYLTRFSGITKEMLDPVRYRLADVQKDIRALLPADAILCGQSLNGDLMALQMFHPYVIDTSIIFNMSGKKGQKTGLRKLTQFFLGREIQNHGSQGHCSHEDAEATLQLVLLKLTKGLEFGDAVLNGFYFPDIQTYFLGEDKNTKTPENVEADLSNNTNSLIKSTDNLNDSNKKQKLEKSKQAAVKSGESSNSSDEEENCEETSDEPPKKKLKTEENTESQTDVQSESKSESQSESKSDSKSESKSEYLHPISSSDVSEEQTKWLFSQENSVHIKQSFFKLVHEAGRSACLIDREKITSNYLEEPIEVVTVENDSQARKTAKREIKEKKEFVMVKFHHGIADGKKQSMRKVDRRIKSVLKHVRENCLVAVVMTGHKGESQLQNMMTFLKIV